jgi:hypothetical protein
VVVVVVLVVLELHLLDLLLEMAVMVLLPP